jgi:hypothetical protein
MMSLTRAAVAALAAVSLLAAPSAHADTASYLQPLHDRFTFLTDDQLMAEGNKVCQAADEGMRSADTVMMVRNDLAFSVSDAIDVVTAAIGDLCQT